MPFKQAKIAIVTVLATTTFVAGTNQLQAAPKPEEALEFSPIQSHIDYDQPTPAEVPRCTVKADKFGTGTAWFVYGPDGVLLRRFADTNEDNVVDQWSYFREGLEVYRDLDSDYNGRADLYRWLHTGGTRIGKDTDEDGRIDEWQSISAQEVAEEMVLAIKDRDARRFNLLLATAKELDRLGMNEDATKELRAQTSSAVRKFQTLAAGQKAITSESQYIDFGASKPSLIPSGTNGSTQDITCYENVSALVSGNGDHKQVYLGTLIAVGDGWRLLDAPSLDDQVTTGFSLTALRTTAAAGGSDLAPTTAMTELMEKLQDLDAKAAQAPSEQQAKLTEERAEILEKLAEVTTDPALRTQWYQQLAEMLSAAVQMGGYGKGVQRLEKLERELDSAGAGNELLAHVRFRRLLAIYMHSQQQPEANFVEIQQQWLKDLEEFATTYPRSDDAAEAQLQLAMSQEFGGSADKAEGWYRKVVEGFPNTERAKKASGALRRLNSEGKVVALRGPALGRGKIDLARLKGKLVLVQFWATWCGPCKQDMTLLKELHAKNKRRGFEVIGVCLDDDPEEAKQFLATAKLPWPHLYEPGGLNSRPANELGVMTLPLMMLVGQDGKVANRSIHAAEVDAEIQRRL